MHSLTEKVADSLPRWPIWLGGLLCTAGYFYLAVQSKGYGGVELGEFLWVLTGVSIVTLALFFCVARGLVRIGLKEILLFAVIFRLTGVWAEPVLEDDHFRYMWDGWMTLNQGTPYDSPPSAWFDSDQVPEAFEVVLDGINYPDVPTVYGPTAQLVFAASTLIAPASILPLQLVAALADLLILVLLARLVGLQWLLLYGWSFLLVKEFAFTAHIDVVGAALLMGAYWLRHIRDQASIWVSLLVGCLAAAALGIKVFALIALPFLLQFDWRSWFSCIATVCLLSVPFGFYSAWLPGGLIAMGEGWIFNAPLYFVGLWAAEWIGPDIILGLRYVGLGLFAGIALFIGWKYLVVPRAHGTFWVTVTPEHYLSGLCWLWCALLLLSPVFNPWYLVWWLPIACIYPNRTAWVCSIAVMLSYISGLNLQDTSLFAYQQPTWVVSVETLAIATALLLDWRRPLTHPEDQA